MKPKELTFTGHLKELRLYLILYSLVLGLLIVPAWLAYKPLAKVILEFFGNQAWILNPADGFMIRFKTSFSLAFIASIPVLLLVIMIFVFPALTGKQKLLFGFLVLISLTLAVASAYYAIRIIFPYVTDFLNDPGFQPASVGKMLSLDSCLDFFFSFTAGFAIAFEMPLVILFLVRIGLISFKFLVSKFRYILILIFIIAAILTPPDVVSQLAMGLPLTVLYLLTLPFAALLEKK
jgi:sec-independent protein translocase protein TatC